jgi:hypothetical protein
MGINLGWNARIHDTMVIESIVMTICMSPFSKPFIDFYSMPKKFTFTNMHFANVAHASLYKVISPSK